MQMYVNKNGQQLGPFEESTVRQMLQNGQLSPNDAGIRQGQNQWLPLGVLFQNAPQSVSLPPPAVFNQTPTAANQMSSPTVKKSGGSKVWLFVLLGLGGLFLVGIGGAALVLNSLNKKSYTATLPNSNSTGSNSASNGSPTKTGETNYKSLLDKAEEFAKLSPPSKIETSPIIKGKVVLVEKDKDSSARILGIDYTGKELQSSDIERYGFSTSRLAGNSNEIGTLIQLSCAKGNRLGTYEGGIAAFANVCKTTVIDYKTPAIIAQKTFTNSVPPQKITTYSNDTREYVLPSPDDLDEFIAGLPLEKLSAPLVELPFDDHSGTYGKYTGFRNLAPELAKISVPESLDPSAAIKGKFACVVQDANGKAELKGIDTLGKELYKYDYEKWGVGSERLAENVGQVETLIKVACKKGNRLGAVGRTAVFANQCEVSIIDYKAFQVVAKKSFENKEMEKDVDTDIYPSRYVVLYPYNEIDEYIKAFPK